MNSAHLDLDTVEDFEEDFDELTEFVRAMIKEGADFTGPKQNVAQLRNLVAYLKMGCPELNSDGNAITSPQSDDEAFTRRTCSDVQVLDVEEMPLDFDEAYPQSPRDGF